MVKIANKKLDKNMDTNLLMPKKHKMKVENLKIPLSVKKTETRREYEPRGELKIIHEVNSAASIKGKVPEVDSAVSLKGKVPANGLVEEIYSSEEDKSSSESFTPIPIEPLHAFTYDEPDPFDKIKDTNKKLNLPFKLGSLSHYSSSTSSSESIIDEEVLTLEVLNACKLKSKTENEIPKSQFMKISLKSLKK